MREGEGFRRVSIQILGHRYWIRTDGDEEHVREVEEYVNRRCRELMESTQTVSTLDLLIKVAISLADELLQERRASEEMRRKVAEEALELGRRIDSHLEELYRTL